MPHGPSYPHPRTDAAICRWLWHSRPRPECAGRLDLRFLGPNGAGKSTTIRLLLDLLRPDRGEIALFGRPLRRDSREALTWVGALVEAPSLYGHLSGRQNLEVTRRLLDAPHARIDAVLQRVGLLEAADRRVREYSLGMRQRLAIALALLGQPRLLNLDQPSYGLDPADILDMRRLLRDYQVNRARFPCYNRDVGRSWDLRDFP